MIANIVKRDGSIVDFDIKKISDAIEKARCASNEKFDSLEIAQKVVKSLSENFLLDKFKVEDIQDAVEKTLILENKAESAKKYILYREQRNKAREDNSLVNATIKMFKDYLDDKDWKISENANTKKSINGMNNYIREIFTKQYWLNEVYPENISKAHKEGDIHIHDLGFFGPYCAGWDLRQLLTLGFGGVEGKVSSGPAKHLRSFLGQIVNATFSTQGECAGAQAWSSIDTYCAPFIREDGLDYNAVKQAIQEFIFNLNVPTRVGFQCPFSNLTFDIKVPSTLKDQSVIIGGRAIEHTYSEYQKEMDIFNLAFCDVMSKGDNSGRVFTFPIPTINVTKDFDWNSDVVDAFMDITCKYGIPYFSNYINSDLSPEDALSMCCRLRLDTTQLRKRGGGLFGSNPLTGSIGVVTLNLPRLAYKSKNEEEFMIHLEELCDIARDSLELKRKIIEKETERNMYPFAKRWLNGIKEKQGSYWANHFNTIGLVGMNEAIMNLFNNEYDLTTKEGQDFAIRVLTKMRDKMSIYQEETGSFYNLEATPAEGTSYRLAKLDKERYPDIIQAGDENNYYTNSSQLPVGYTEDIFETLDLQDELQSLYTGGTVLHLYIGERLKERESAKKLIKTVFSKYKLPYISITPTFSICEDHGYIAGEVHNCPNCNKETEVWTRVVGYLRPVANFHKGKKEEYKDRKLYKVDECNCMQA